MIAIYVRSSKEDDESNSVENQIREGKNYALKNNYTPDQIIIYNEGQGLKGSDTIKKRPELKRMMKDVKSGIIKMVYVRKQNRLARKLKIFNEILDELIECKIEIFMADKGLVDLQSPLTKMMLQIMGAFDEYAPNSQSIETIKALKDNAKEGKVVGIIPYGYCAINSIPHIIKEEQQIINRIFDLYLDGNGCQRIANILNEDKVPTKYHKLELEEKTKGISSNRKHRNGVIWQSSTIYGLLNQSWYNGIRTYQKTEYPVPRMITKKKWQLVQNKKEVNKHQRFDGTPKYDYLLKGILKCEKCGRNFIGRYRESRNDNFYQCSSKRSGQTNCGTPLLNITKIESFIIQHLFESKDLLNHLKQIQNENTTLLTLNEQLQTIKNNIKSKSNEVNNYANLLGGQLKDNSTILNKFIIAEEALKTLKQKQTTLEHKIELASSDIALKEYENSFDKIKLSNDFKTINDATHQLINYITVEGSKDVNGTTYFIIKINYKELNIGEEEFTIWTSKRPLNKWLPLQHTRPATPKEIEKLKTEAIEAFEFAYGEKPTDEQAYEIPNNFTTYYDFESIILNKENLVNFNKK